MKRSILLVAMLCTIAVRGSFYSTGTIADGNPTGATFSCLYDQAAAGSTVSSITLSLQISGGYNGDLYGYLVSPDGTMVTLMNRPGVALNNFGATGSGMNILLQDGVTDHGNIQNETGAGFLTGSYNSFGNFSTFNGSTANGTWTLFFADQASGGGTSTLESWSLEITAVPEPTGTALVVFVGVACLSGTVRIIRSMRQNHQF